MALELRVNILISIIILCISSIYCKIQRDCLFRTPLGVSRANLRDKPVPLSGPNIFENDKFKERMELIKNVKRKMEIKSKQKIKSKKSEKSFDQLIKTNTTIEVSSMNIEDSNNH